MTSFKGDFVIFELSGFSEIFDISIFSNHLITVKKEIICVQSLKSTGSKDVNNLLKKILRPKFLENIFLFLNIFICRVNN